MARGDGRYRLPTEAEWEYAARAGSTTKYSFGDNEGSLENHAWYSKNSGGTIHEVATKQANAWGLYDMYGNVSEWVQDWAGDYPSGSVTDPTGPASGKNRVVRGGSWQEDASIMPSAVRSSDTPGGQLPVTGFRVLRTK